MTEPLTIHDAVVTNTDLVVGNRKMRDTIGPHCTLKGCTLSVKGRGFLMVQATLKDCLVRVTASVKNIFLTDVRLERCRFEGRLDGFVFGHCGDRSDLWEEAMVRECDLSKARILRTRFHRCRAEEQHWAAWPTVVVHRVTSHLAEWQRLQLPPELENWQAIIAVTAPQYDESTVFVDDLSDYCSAETLSVVREMLRGRSFVLET